MKKSLSFFLILTVLLVSCTKDNDGKIDCSPSGDGKISVSLDNQAWNACQFRAVYYPKGELLSLVAIDENQGYEIRFYITIDTITPVKTYYINANENNGLEVIQQIPPGNNSPISDIYVCDYQKPGLGGYLTITSLDTMTGRISGQFHAVGFSKDQNKTISLDNGIIDNAKLTTSYRANDACYVKTKINGTNWHTNNVNAYVGLTIGAGLATFLNVSVPGYPYDYGDCQTFFPAFARNSNPGRELNFTIPLMLGLGTHPLEPSNVYIQTVSSQHFLSNFRHFDFDNKYYPTTGSSITITSLDNTTRNLHATFNMQAKDAQGNIFNFTAGEINLTRWR
jgi:hypothetical protein